MWGLDQAEIRVVLSGDEERFGAPVELARRDLIEAAKKSDVALSLNRAGAPMAGHGQPRPAQFNDVAP